MMDFRKENEKMNTASMENCAKEPGYINDGRVSQRKLSEDEQERLYLIGKNVRFAPPQACKLETTPDLYPAIIVKTNGPSAEFGGVRTCDLVTFGPNSVYFQHNVPFSGHGIKPGHWTYKD